jgi:xanthine dehydrogenase YagT iron-sulfur-binding subunit
MTDDVKRDERRGDGAQARAGLSRRSFLRGTAAAGLVPLIAGDTAGAAEAPRREQGARIYGPGPVTLKLTVNGERREVAAEPRATLLDTLRDELGLTGAKRVCDRGTCGACTVLLDGRPVYACSVLTVAAHGGTVETVEAIGRGRTLHPLQAAFVENDAQQCGFCTPGFVVAAKALLDAHPRPTPEQVLDGLSGNFCRCGTYDGLKRAVAAAGKGGGDA